MPNCMTGIGFIRTLPMGAMGDNRTSMHCPYKTPNRWRQTDGNDLVKAYEVDEAIRHGLERVGVDEPCYLSDRLIPVEQLIRKGDPQPSLPGLDAPGCDGGACFL